MFRKLLLALAAVCLMTGSAVAADAFPNRPITIVVPFAAGGETDLVARMLADGMSKELKQVMVVQNIVGASGVAGISAVTRGQARRLYPRRNPERAAGHAPPHAQSSDIRWIRSTSWAVSSRLRTSSWSPRPRPGTRLTTCSGI